MPLSTHCRLTLCTGQAEDRSPPRPIAVDTFTALLTFACTEPPGWLLQVDINAVTKLVVELALCLMFDGPPPHESLLCNAVQSYITVRKKLQYCHYCRCGAVLHQSWGPVPRRPG